MTKNNTISITLCPMCEGEISKPEQYIQPYIWQAIKQGLLACHFG